MKRGSEVSLSLFGFGKYSSFSFKYSSSNFKKTSSSLTPAFNNFVAFPVISLYTPCTFTSNCLYTLLAIFDALPNRAALCRVPSNAGSVITSSAVRELFILM
ncbi:hypothetical protein SIO70_32355 [Chitinophaga sancti]|uniref:hypothetical protein n=1 Tax=Chitinophaga sancti TaxID=1004 RepID=UPI002A752383|nr:hypothetical protein [Chitinophaga sancti]WPQ63061.1 hypothetical protein SIO70_32355 [Chitinophaga sancti]